MRCLPRCPRRAAVSAASSTVTTSSSANMLRHVDLGHSEQRAKLAKSCPRRRLQKRDPQNTHASEAQSMSSDPWPLLEAFAAGVSQIACWSLHVLKPETSVNLRSHGNSLEEERLKPYDHARSHHDPKNQSHQQQQVYLPYLCLSSASASQPDN